MSKFVNYQKRSISLPRGCKNLIDVLRPRADKMLEQAQPGRGRGESVMGTVSAISKYVGMAFSSRGLAFTLLMGIPDEDFVVVLLRMEKKMIWMQVETSSHRDRAVRDFIERRGLNMPAEPPTPAHGHPEVPGQLGYDISPLPADAPAVATLAADLFRDACGLNDDSPLLINYTEFSDAG